MKRVFLTWIVGTIFWGTTIFILEFLSLPLSQPGSINLYAIKDYKIGRASCILIPKRQISNALWLLLVLAPFLALMETS